MIEELNISLNNLYDLIKQPNPNDISLKKELYNVLRASLKNKQYEIAIGELYINLNPPKILIKTEKEDLLIEINTEEIYYETERETEPRFFCITNEQKETYSLDTPTIEIKGHVMNIKEHKRAEYIFSLINTQEELNIKEYLKDNNLEIINPTTALLTLDIEKDTPIIKYEDYLDTTKLKQTYLDYQNNEYITINIPKDPETYSMYLPDISNKIVLLKKLFDYIIEFYNEYSSKEIFQ